MLLEETIQKADKFNTECGLFKQIKTKIDERSSKEYYNCNIYFSKIEVDKADLYRAKCFLEKEGFEARIISTVIYSDRDLELQLNGNNYT